MTDKLQERLKKAVDRSGFPLQLRLEKVLNNLHNWVIEGRELYWEIKGYSGFIDTVYGGDLVNKKVVTEVKKTSAGEWIFLIDSNSKNDAHSTISLIASKDKTITFNWQDLTTDHFTIRSSFCIVNGQNEANPMLERLCTNLLMATEAFARKDSRDHLAKEGSLNLRYYLPVIITNTPLYICEYDTNKVDLDTGLLTEEPEFKKINSVAFQKPFWSCVDTATTNNYSSQFKYNEAQDRTVFIVHSEAFSKFLKDIDPYTL